MTLTKWQEAIAGGCAVLAALSAFGVFVLQLLDRLN